MDVGAVGANSGVTWGNAFTNLQAAITNSPSGSELWVRAGVYAPIALRTNTAVYGGFTGTETNRGARNWQANTTWINGGGARAVTIAKGATLDGVTITNTAGVAGSVYFNRVHGTLANCRIVGNVSNDAVQLLQPGDIEGGTTLVSNCEFRDHTGTAVFYNGRTNLVPGPHLVTIDRCLFVGNQTAGSGGAIRTDHAAEWLKIQNCVFERNAAAGAGGAFYIAYNQFSPGTDVQAINCTFYSNACPAGKAICVAFESARLNLQNCIVWGATNDQIRTQNGSPSVQYGFCDIEGGEGAVYIRHGSGTNLGNILDADPQFADAAFHLGDSSPCIDTGFAGGAPDYDRDGLLRPQGAGVDMGAYEVGAGMTGAMILIR